MTAPASAIRKNDNVVVIAGRDRGKRILWVQGEEVENSHNPYSWVIGYDGKGRDMGIP